MPSTKMAGQGTGKRRRTPAERKHALKQEQAALQKETQLASEMRKERAKQVLEQKVAKGLSWEEMEGATGIHYQQLQRDLRRGEVDAYADLINKAIDKPQFLEKLRRANDEGKRRRAKYRGARSPVRRMKKPPGD